ncbi:MAG: competence protein ComEC [Methylophilales bacterium 28-44-11]|nr:MAG: competence protein ComEC [Methylophilales bacterium 28-44-11]
MVVIALGFVAGAWMLQQQASLPMLSQLLFMGTMVVMLIAAIPFLQQRFCNRSFFNQHAFALLFTRLTYFIFATALGFTWAWGIANLRLSDALPSDWEQKTITISGVVATLPEQTERGQRFLFDVEHVLTPHAQLPKHISLNIYAPYNASPKLVSTIQVPQVQVGERWQWSVRLKRPHGVVNPHGFDFEGWALAENIRAMGTVRLKSGTKKLAEHVTHPAYWVENMRANIAERIDKTLAGQPYAGVIRALVIGEDSQISQTDWDIYLRTGTNHLMSISGLHITMLSGLMFAIVYWIWRRFPALLMHLPAKKAAAIGGMLTAMTYAAMAGFSIPTQRTLYMLMTVTLMLLLNRPIAISRMLAIALLVVVFLDPWAVNAAGFWLSFGAVIVIAFATGARIGQIHWFTAAVKAQWAVTLGLLPCLVMMFGQFSIVSPIANAIAIPIISFLVVPLAILGSLIPIEIALYLSHTFLSITMIMLDWLAALPYATWQQSAPSTSILLLAMLGVVCLLLSVVVQTAHHRMLYDAGTRFNAQSDAGGRIVVPYLLAEGIQSLSAMVLSHDDLDHSGGMASVANQLPVGWLMSSLKPDAILFQQPPFDYWSDQKKLQCHAGQYWHWDAVKFEVLYPPIERLQDENTKDNDKSCVIKMTTRYGSLLLTGDIERSAELSLLAQQSEQLSSDVMVVPHHGSKTSSSIGFIEAVNPTYVVMTNGYLNRFGHPKPLIQQRYVNAGTMVYRSDYDGAIQFLFQADQPLAPVAWRKAFPKYWHDRYP